MKPILFAGILGWAAVAAAGAEGGFTAAVPPGDFAAAGLAKLTPAERAKLDQLVQDYKSGAIAAAQREAAAATEARSAAEARVAQAEAQVQAARTAAETQNKNEGGLWEKARVLVAPGTKIEYAATEGRLRGEFTGWEHDQVFTLENGQRWKVDHYADEYYTAPVANPPVSIVPASMGGFWLKFPELGVQVKARLLK